MKTVILLIYSLLISLFSFSQQLFEVQLRTDQKEGYNFSSANGGSVRTNDGGFIIVGQSRVILSNPEFIINIYKFDKNGKQQWSKFYKTFEYSFYSAIVQTTDGGYAVAGLMSVFKTDSLGKLLWSKSYKNLLFDANIDGATKLVNAADGSLILGGGMDSSGEYSGRLYILKLSSTTGSILAFRAFGSFPGYHEQFGDIYRTSDNGYLLCGNIRDKNTSSPRMLVVKVSATFSPQWQKIITRRYYTEYSMDYATDAVETSDGNYVIAGHSYASYDPVRQFRTFDACVIKLDKTGNQLWSKQIGGISNDYAYAITKTEDSSIVIAGSYGDSATQKGDGLIFKLNSKGELGWLHTVGETNTEYFCSLIKTSDNTLTASGISYSSGADNGSLFVTRFTNDGNSCNNNPTPGIVLKDFPDTVYSMPVYTVTLLNSTSPKFSLELVTPSVIKTVVCKSRPASGIAGMQEENNIIAEPGGISVFPNPVTSGLLNINFTHVEAQPGKLSIYDLQGRKVFTKNILGSKELSINIAQLHAGVYFLKIVSGNKQTTAKFIKID